MIYKFLKQIVKVLLFFFFKKVIVSGKEHLNSKGPLIIVANHPNTFMDPFIVASLVRRRVGFIANAGIFVNKVLNSIFDYFHVIPVYRKKDVPIGERPDNSDAFTKCHDYLSRDGALLIFPEGSSYYELKLREIKTGTARIALGFEALKGFKGNLKILPIALDYSDSIQFRSTVAVTFCPPIEVDKFEASYREDAFNAALELTELIRKVLSERIPQTTGKDQEHLLISAHQFYASFFEPESQLNKDPKQSLIVRNQVSKALQFLEEEDTDLYQYIEKRLFLFFMLLKEEGLSPAIVATTLKGKHRLFSYMVYVMQLLLLFPIYVFGVLANYLPYVLTAKIFVWLKLDISYRAPVQMMTGLVTYPLFYVLNMWLFRQFVSEEFWYSVMLLCLMPISGYIAMYFYAEMQRFRRLLHFELFVKKTKKSQILTLKEDILTHMEKVRKDYMRVSSL